jgi:hypothetical protein
VPKWYRARYGDSRWVCSGAGIGYEDAQRRPGIPGWPSVNGICVMIEWISERGPACGLQYRLYSLLLLCISLAVKIFVSRCPSAQISILRQVLSRS